MGFNTVADEEATGLVEENTPATNVEVTMDINEFLSAGLDPEDIYRLDIKKMAVVEKTVKEGDNKGQKYRTIDAEIHLVERFGHGILEYPVKVWDYGFGIRGKRLERFRTLYTEAFGPIQKGKGTQSVSINDMAASLVGVDTVWGVLYWRRNWRDKDEIEQVLGYNFSSSPQNLKAPRPFAERDSFNQSKDEDAA